MNAVQKDMVMAWASFNRQMFNPTIVKHNQFDAHIATAKNSGTHWIKHMLGHIVVQMFDGVEPPKTIADDSIIGHPKNPPVYDHIPQIALTHSHPHYTMRMPALYDVLKIPACAFVVRNPKDLLVSLFEKHKGEFLDKTFGAKDVSFSQYLRADMTRKYDLETLWGVIRFFNGWGAVEKNAGPKVLRIRYEDLQADTPAHMRKLCDHIGLEKATDSMIESAIEKSSKKEMRKHLDPNRTQADKVVNLEKRQPEEWYSPEDKAFFEEMCARYLKYDFGYFG